MSKDGQVVSALITLPPQLVLAAGSATAAIVAAVKSHGAKKAARESQEVSQENLEQLNIQLGAIQNRLDLVLGQEQSVQITQIFEATTKGDPARLTDDSPHRRL